MSESNAETKTEKDAEAESRTEPRSETEDDSETEAGTENQAESTEPEAGETGSAVVEADEQIEGVPTVRQSVESSAGRLIGDDFDAVSEISPIENGWHAVVEVVERSSVPDTQDILGRYEIELDEDSVVHGYRRLDRYRRGDTTAFERRE